MLFRIVVFCIAVALPQAAVAADDAFAGKTINIIAGLPPGGEAGAVALLGAGTR